MKKLSRILVLILTLSIVFSSLQAGVLSYASEVSADESTSDTTEDSYTWAKGPSISAKTAVLMEASTGTILYSKKPDKKMYPASLTKILTALIAIENCSLSEKVTFSDDAVYKTEGSSAGLKPGEIITMEDCLYALMLESANEVAYAIAEHVAGSYDDFIAMMNDYAAELGCKNTHFANPHGLHDENHYTTAYDLALISKAAMENSIFRTVTYTQTYQIPETNITDEVRYCNNHQQMRYAYRYPKFKYEYCTGGKTGYTEAAGYTLASFAEKDGMELICIVMDAGSPYEEKNEYTDSIGLLDFGYEKFELVNYSGQTADISDDLATFGEYNTLFNQEESPLTIEDGGKIILPKDAATDQVVSQMTPLAKTVEQDDKTVVGQITYQLGDRTIGSSNVLYTAPEPSETVPVVNTEPSVTEDASETQEGEKENSKTSPWIIVLIVIGVIIFLGAIALFVYFHVVVKPKRRSLSNRAYYMERVSYRPQKRGRSKRNKYNRFR